MTTILILAGIGLGLIWAGWRISRPKDIPIDGVSKTWLHEHRQSER